MVKFLHTSDWHLGMRRHFLTEEAEPRYRQERLDAVRRLGEVAAEEGCAFIVAAGDSLDSNQVDPGTLARAIEVLRALPVPVYLLPGNHDPADAGSMLVGSARQWGPRRGVPSGDAADAADAADKAGDTPIGSGVHVLARPGVTEVAPGVEIVAAPWRTRRPLVDLVAEACAELEPGPLRILLGHGAVDALSPDGEDPALVRLADAEAALAGELVHYVALGDRHSATSVGETGRIWYSGSPEVTGFAEVDAGKVLVVELDRDAVRVKPHALGRWRFMRLEHAFAGDEDVVALEERLRDLPDKERTVVRLSLEGTLSLSGSAMLEAVLEEMGHVFAGMDTSEGRSEVAIVPADADFEALELSGFARSAMETLRSASEKSGSHADRSRDALGLLVRLAGRTA